MAVALAVPAAAFSGMAIPLPTAVERIAAALVSGRTDIVSDVDAAAIQAAQAAALEETAPHESDAVFVEPNATPTALAAQVAAVSASADVPTASASPAPLDLHLNAATIVSLAGLSPGSNPVAGWTGAAPDPTASPPGGSANGGGGDDSGGGDGGSNGDGGSGPGDPPGEEAEPIPTLETPATRSKAPKDALDDARADTKAPKKAPKKVQKANDDQSSSGFDAQDSEPAPPDGVTFIDAVAPNLDVWVTTEEAKESVPPASADTDSTTLETDEDAGAEASVEARGGDVSESPAKTEDDDSRPSTDTSRVDPAGPETAGQGQSDDPKKSS